MSIHKQIQKNVSNYYKMLVEQASAQYVKETLLGLGILVGLTVGYALRNYYVQQREQRAFGDLVEVMESFEKSQYETMTADQNQEKVIEAWQDTEVFVDALYKKNSGSYLAPYFLIFKSQIALERGDDVDSVRNILEDALKQIPKNSDMFSLFDLKRIKMALDSLDEKVRDEALKDLIALSKNEEGVVFEEASYLLGSYYMFMGDFEKAAATWENSLKFADKKSLVQSPWLKESEEKLNSIKHV